MALQIRRAALDRDRAQLIGLFKRCLTPTFDEQRFERVYCKGPYGAAPTWVAFDGSDGAIVGAAAAFPRRMYVGGEVRLGCVLGDFCIEEKYRSLGPAVLLQRACLEEAAGACFEFCYDFPSPSMMAVYKRLEIDKAGILWRWAKPLRAERKLASVIPSKALVKGLGAIVNAALAHRGWKGSADVCELAVHEGMCGEEFTTLDSHLCPKSGIRTVRTAEYLNWRYLSDSGTSYQILTARRAGILIAYAVFAQELGYASIVDLCSVEEPAVIGRVLAGAVELLRRRGVSSVSLNAGDRHPWNPLFERAGFRKREQSPLIIYTRPQSNSVDKALRSNWYLMRGERDS